MEAKKMKLQSKPHWFTHPMVPNGIIIEIFNSLAFSIWSFGKNSPDHIKRGAFVLAGRTDLEHAKK